MMTEVKAFFIIPVFNEAENLPQVLEDTKKLTSMVQSTAKSVTFIFVDDGSTDATHSLLTVVNRPGWIVLKHSVNQGPGAAFETAFAYLLKNGLNPEDLVITLEGDATNDPQIFSRMLQRLSEGDDLVLASPYLYGGGFSSVASHRLILSHIANFLFKLILKINGLATFSCFYRIYKGRALIQITKIFPGPIVTQPGFECAAEILLKAVRSKLAITEVPFRVDWGKRKGKSKMRILKTSLGYLRLFLQYGRMSQ